MIFTFKVLILDEGKFQIQKKPGASAGFPDLKSNFNLIQMNY